MSEDYIVRASIAPVFARSKGHEAIPRLLQMEREASHDIEKTLILSALMIAGDISKKLSYGRALWGRAKRAEMLNDAIEMGASRKAGAEKGIRNELNNLLN